MNPPKASKPTKWKAMSAVLLTPGDAVRPPPTNGDGPPAKNAIKRGGKAKARPDL